MNHHHMEILYDSFGDLDPHDCFKVRFSCLIYSLRGYLYDGDSHVVSKNISKFEKKWKIMLILGRNTSKIINIHESVSEIV